MASMLANVKKGRIIRPVLMLIYGPGGIGKCLKTGTPVLMHDGRVLPVEMIEEGDLLMGPDSEPRVVLKTHEGSGRLFKIKPNKGEAWSCNENHILTIWDSYKKKAIDIPILDWLNLPYNFRRKYAQLIRSAVFFESQKVELDPYFCGLWIGDGTARSYSVQITKPDVEILETLDKVAIDHGLIRKSVGITHNLVSQKPTGIRNSLKKKILKMVNMTTGEKLIPRELLINDEEVRLNFLAGLIDTDGSLICGCYEFSTKWENVSRDVLFLARSLGFAAYAKPKIVNDLKYWRLFISGDIDRIPCKIARKKAAKRKQVKNVLHVGFSVEEKEKGEWFGFELDKDQRFL